MIDVAILMLPGGSPSTVVGPHEVFNTAGRTFRRLTGRKGRRLFGTKLVSVDGEPVAFQNGMQIAADCSIDAVKNPDIVMVGSCGGNIGDSVARSTPVIGWLTDQHQRGAVIGSVCTGLVVLAETGLLNGKRATTHWGLMAEIRRRYPKINMIGDELFVQSEANLYTGGGSYAGNDLALHLVGRFCGETVKRECAKVLVLESQRQAQTCHIGIMHHRLHGDDRVHAVQDWLDGHFHEVVSFDDIAIKHNMSPRNFHRRFREASGETPLGYLQKQRIEAAKALLETEDTQIDRVSERVGYADVNHFRRIFKRYTSLTPKSYRERFGKN